MKILIHTVAVILSPVLLACGGSRPADAEKTGSMPPLFPDYIGVTVPPNVAPLNFEVEGADEVWVELATSDGKDILLKTGGKYADFPIKKWHKALEAVAGDILRVTVYAKIEGEWREFKPFNINVTPGKLPDHGLTYRRIAPGYETYSKMGIYQRDLSTFDEEAIIENSLTETNSCINCHTSNRGNPAQCTFHMRGKMGGTYVKGGNPDIDGEWYDVVSDSLISGLVYPYWHPSGKYCAYSNNTTSQGFINTAGHPVEVYDGKSDIVLLDVANRSIVTSPLLKNSGVSENTPAFSPDGKWLYFITAPEVKFPEQYKDIKYNICRIGFDETKGAFGNSVDTLFNASAIGKSATWPRPSYDGKRLLFTLADYGYFSVWHPEAEQWIMDLDTGEAKPISDDKVSAKGSYHNWSTDSRWIVFTSRHGNDEAENGDERYTRLYLAYVDENGEVGKPFLLPQKNPRQYYDETLYSFNTPDFTHEKVDYDARKSMRKLKEGKQKLSY